MPKPPLPKMGWTSVEILDGQLITGEHRCEFCNRRIRWVHLIEHPDRDGAHPAGCCCAIRLCDAYDAEGAEREARNRAARFRTFADRSKWKVSKNNPRNIWRRVRVRGRGMQTVTVYEATGRYGVFRAGKKDDKHSEPPCFDTQQEAMERAFEIVDAANNDEG